MAALPKPEKFVLTSTLKMGFTAFLAVLFAFQVTMVATVPEDPLITYDMLYTSGVEAYNSQRWYECGSFLLRALEDYKQYREELVTCRLKCRAESKTNINSTHHLDLAFFDLSLRRSNCLRRCKKAAFGPRPEVTSEKIESDFENLEPYNYLQLCAYKTGLYEHAVSAAYTYLLAHPDHEIMKNNILFYRAMSEVKPEYFKNLEAREYQVLYKDGVEAYTEEEYSKVVDVMEAALHLYYTELEKCHTLCEGPFDHESLPDQFNAIADHYIASLECELGCPKKLATFMGKEIPDYLPEHYNYLQFSYFKMGLLQKACEAVGSFLLFYPNNEEMVTNREYYMAQDDITADSFKPDKDAAEFIERRNYMEEQMTFIRKHYKFADADLDRIGLERKKKRLFKEHLTPEYGPHDDKYLKQMELYRDQGVNISLTEKELEGKHRVAVDGLISQTQCERLMQLAGVGAKQGDGYLGGERRVSPHTDYEKFEGLTVDKAAQLAKAGVVTDDLADLYLKISNRARIFSQHYWNLQSPLYFHFTHLVCRTALDDQTLREDLSHPVHSDNCHIQQDGSCPRRPPAYTQRDFSALIYLNGDFEGGDFFFAHKNLSVHQKIQPRCGRMVAFEAGDYHGVQAVSKGRRCAVAIWFTLSQSDAEQGHREAQSILRHMQVMKKMENRALRDLLDSEDIRVLKTENELDGPERFAADGLVTKEQCDKLIQLANEGGQVGDGYSSARTAKQPSPHTRHERFAALSIRKAAELAAAGKVDLEAVQLYLDIAEKGRFLTETYFGLKTPLFFDFTHLVCRTALDGENEARTDLSHPVHSDNCILQKDGSCLRQAPAYVQRDYSGIIYLNGDFKGGEFFFAHPNLTVQKQLKPHAGMMVSFNASNLHGVKAVQRGQRCAIALWFTLNKNFKEKAHLVARKVVSDLQERRRIRHSEL